MGSTAGTAGRKGAFLWALAALIILWVLWSRATSYWLQGTWFGVLGYAAVFWKVLGWKWLLGLGGGVLAAIWLTLNTRLARRLVPAVPDEKLTVSWQKHDHALTWVVRAGIILFGLIGMGNRAAAIWDEVLRYLQQVPFGENDPVFGLDLGFYLFSMPLYSTLTAWLLRLGALTVVLLVVVYLVYDARTRALIGGEAAEEFWHKQGSSHLAVTLGLIAVVIAFRSLLARYALVYDPSGVVVGAGYADVHGRIPAYLICAVIGLLLAVGFWTSAVSHSWRPAVTMAVIWLLAHVIILGVFPWGVQVFRVRPNELKAEEPYIARNIEFTKKGFGLGDVSAVQFSAEAGISRDLIEANPQTVQNIRLWDYRPMWDTLKQEQELRLYYEFGDTDIDRYRFADQYRQVMLAARELNQDELPAKAQQWVPQRLQYTHGYGLCLAPVNESTPEGRPNLWLKGMPVNTTQEGFPTVTQPGIYYGELTHDRVYVNTGIDEIDYPVAEDFAETQYAGTGGIPIGSGFRRFVLAYKFDFFRILLSEYIEPDSKVLWRRSIDQRMKSIAPFLRYDHDPYMVVGDDGRLWWIRDAYTVANTFPYSERYTEAAIEGHMGKRMPTAALEGANYVRNSVKVVVDAYNGSVDFYVVDPGDPIIRTYQRIFPGLFRPLDEMPMDVRTHIRYPETLFLAQAHIYTDYHMSRPRVFYTREDKWHVATEVYGDSRHSQRVEPYYIIMRLPGEEHEEFILMLPFTPKNKPNLIAWMAARCDEPNYGEVVVFLFPKGKLVHGTLQVENRIDQDENISPQLTLWGQRGSEVIRGNLLVIPIGDSLLYVEPLYLQAEAGKYPELKKVLIATQDRLVMGDNLYDALQRLLAGVPIVAAGPPEERRSVAELVAAAAGHLARAEELAGEGRWREQGAEMEALKEVLAQLQQQVR